MIKVNKFFIPYIAFLIIVGFSGQLAISFLAVILHEGVHYITSVFFGFTGFDMKILPIGAVLELKDLDEATPKEDLIISLSGPLFNLFLSVLFFFLNSKSYSYYYELIAKSNLALGLFNLIPAFPLDGGRIIRDILSIRTIYKRANELAIRVSMILGTIIICGSIFFAILGRINYNILIIGIFILIASYREKERIVYIIMGDIIKKKNKFISKKYIENKSISIFYKGDLISVLSLVDKNKYNIFTVLDEDMKVMDIIYEEEILQALKTHGNITIEEFVKIRDDGGIME